MRLASLLPSFTWNVDPVFLQLPKSAVAAAIAAIGVFSLLVGLKRQIKDQSTSGIFFLILAGAMMLFLGDKVELRYYSLLFVVVFLGGHALLNWQIKRGGGGPEVASDFIVYGVLGVLIGARLGHVLFYDLDHAIEDPWWVFKIWTGGLASHGAVIGLITVMYIFTKRRGVPFLEGADRFAFAATLGATVVRIGNLMNSEIVGRVVPDQSWGIRFPRFDHEALKVPLRYPSQIFEILLGIGVFAGLWIADRAMGKEKRPRGAMISWFFVLYFTGRLFTERYKEIEALPKDSAITMGQYLSVPGVLLGVVGLWYAFKRREPTGWVEAGDEPAEGDEDELDEASSSSARDEDDEDDDESTDDAGDGGDGDDDDDQDDDTGSKADPDVEDEFEGGKLKKRRDP
jgi:phosphatidylglycerol:prolipoprotein diacylglycerol transferase